MPQPIDFQTELGRTTIAERMLGAAQRGPLAAQQLAEAEAARARRAAETDVEETAQARNQGVSEDGKEGASDYEQAPGEGGKTNPAAAKPKRSRRPSPDGAARTLDISI